MTHRVTAAFKHRLQLFCPCDVCGMELSARWHVSTAAIPLVVYDGDFMTIGQQPATQMGADKACATSDDNLHNLTPSSSLAAALRYRGTQPVYGLTKSIVALHLSRLLVTENQRVSIVAMSR